MQFIDIAKFIGILSIVDVHIESGAIIPAGNTFHVLVFFVIAGLLEKQNKAVSFAEYAKKKAWGLLYPYVTLSLINICMQVGICFVRGREIWEVLFPSLLRTVTLGGIGTLWFLPVLYLASLLSKGFREIKQGVLYSVILAVGATYICAWVNRGTFLESISANVIANNAVMVFASVWIAQGFVTLGCIMQKTMRVFQEKSKRNLLFSLVGGVVLYAADICLWHRGYSCDLHKLRIPDATQYLICGLSGTGAVLAFANALTYIPRVRDFLAWSGQNSIVIMTTHKEFYVTFLVNIVCTKLLGELSGFERMIPLIITMCVEVILVYVISHSSLRYLFSSPMRKRRRETV